MNTLVIKSIKKLFIDNNVTYETFTFGGVEYEFYFKEKNACLFVIDEDKYNEKTISKNYFKELIDKFGKEGIELILLYSTYFANKFEVVSSRLLYKLKNDAIKVDARKCEVGDVSYKDSKDFLEMYHFQGNVMSKTRIGLYYKKELVSLIVLSKPRYNREYEYEIGRYAVKFNYNVRGNFSKMISYFVDKYSPKTILTYHDILFGNNKVYEKAGFVKIQDSPPGFFWYKDGKTFNRRGWWKNTLNKKLDKFDPSISAHSNMRENGFIKIFDIGQAKFVLTVNSQTVKELSKEEFFV